MTRSGQDWTAYWDTDHPIYVNDRHLDLHYRAIAQQIIEMIRVPAARVLDYGCGEALHADEIAPYCVELYLCEAAPKLRARLKQRFARVPSIRVISPEELDRLPAVSFDLVIINSVVQYLTREEFAYLLPIWKKRLRLTGRIVIADVIGPNQSALKDAAALLSYARKNGFLLAAFFGLVRTVFSPYRSLRARLGLSRYSEAEMIQILHAAGLNAERMSRNLGHIQNRMAFRASRQQ
ncbi:MAG TPA: class I SAM-dependent methyltransferase [Xanthobacteraceae bacterium]|jgi:SAM-dependent methyltransferase